MAAFLCSGEIFEETFCSKRQLYLNLDILYRVYMFTNSVQKTSISSWLSNKIASSNVKLQATFVSL